MLGGQFAGRPKWVEDQRVSGLTSGPPVLVPPSEVIENSALPAVVLIMAGQSGGSVDIGFQTDTISFFSSCSVV